MDAALANLAVGAAIVLTGVSAVLLVVGLIAYGRTRHVRMLWISFAFALFLVQGLVLSWQVYGERGDIAASRLPALVFVNLGIVLALYLAVLKR